MSEVASSTVYCWSTGQACHAIVMVSAGSSFLFNERRGCMSLLKKEQTLTQTVNDLLEDCHYFFGNNFVFQQNGAQAH